MTMHVPLIGSCPNWSDDIPPSRDAESRAILARVQQDVFATASTRFLTPTDPRRWHGMLFRAFVPLDYYAGNCRGVEVTKPCLAVDVGVSSPAGMAPGASFLHVRAWLDQLFDQFGLDLGSLELRWGQLVPADRATQLAIVIANLVGGFIQLHPFINGNGRTSRLLWRWSLLRFGVPPLCCIHPRPDPPYSAVMAAAMRGNYQPLVLYILSHLNAHPPSQN